MEGRSALAVELVRSGRLWTRRFGSSRGITTGASYSPCLFVNAPAEPRIGGSSLARSSARFCLRRWAGQSMDIGIIILEHDSVNMWRCGHVSTGHQTHDNWTWGVEHPLHTMWTCEQGITSPGHVRPRGAQRSSRWRFKGAGSTASILRTGSWQWADSVRHGGLILRR